jgi:signal transduction histidine kinase
MRSPEDKLGRRILGPLLVGIFVALANFALDVSFPRSHVVPATTVLNDLIIGAAAGLLAYIWLARQTARHLLELSRQKLTQEAIDQERKRIALDLHDTVCQAHAAAIMQLECVQDSPEMNRAAQEHLLRALQLVRGATAEMRCVLWDLYPEEMQKVDLRTAIEYLSKNLTAGSGTNVHISLDGTMRQLPPDIQRGLLRISQEALSNVVKHAQARDVSIELLLDSEQVHLCIRDNGQGFWAEPEPGTFGLASMENRAKALGGVWEIHGEPGRGTEVRASLPLVKPAKP